MSYSLRIVKDSDGIRLDEASLSGTANLPEGTLNISGHHVGDGEAGTESVSISLSAPTADHTFYCGASGNVSVDRRKPSAEA